MSSKMSSKKLIVGSIMAASCAMMLIAIAARAQYNTYDSDSNSDSEGGPTLSNAELGKLVRNSAKSNAGRNSNLRSYSNQQQQLAATRNLYNKQQPLQYAPTQSNRRQYGSSDLSGYSPMGAAASGSQANNDDDDNEGGNFGGANFGANFDSNDNDGESQADGQPMNLNQAASGYPGQGDYNEGFNFGGASGPSSGEAGADFGLGEGFGSGDGRRAKSASSLMGLRNMGGDDDAGAPQFGPNSAVNSGDNDDEGRSGYAPENNDNDNDDE